jgi:hypothetical protein
MSTAPVETQPAAPVPAASPFIQTVDPATYTEDAPPFPANVVEILATEPDKDDVEERRVSEDSDKTLLYVPWVHYQRVLARAFGPGGFRLVPRGPSRTEGRWVTWKFALFVRAPGQPRFQFIDEAIGECNLQGGRMSPANAAEGAKSDALVKCCKRLGIFIQLWDPNWRRAWERHHAGKKRQQVRNAAWPVGEGGAAPTAAVPAPASSSVGGDAETAAPVSAPAGTPAPDAAAPDGPDTGEPASDEQKAACIAEVKRLRWTSGYLKLWIAETFGVQVADARRAFEALSGRQCDAAYALMTYHGKGAIYDQVKARLRAEGSIP